MPFRSLVKYVFLARRCGWYACRQHMLKQGYTMISIAAVLVCLLRLQGLNQASENLSTN